MKKFIYFLLMVFLYQFSNAQNTIKGKITDQNNEPLAGATIFVTELNKGTVANKDGEFELNNFPNGKFKIRFSFVGYENKIETIIFKDTTIVMNISILQIEIETEEIVVSGGYNSTQHENAVKIEVLKINSRQNLSTPNFAEILTKVPGIDMISKGAGVAKPVIRGLSMNDILVLNNGVRFENYQYSNHHPLGIDEFGIENVEIIKGPASLLYGSDAIGGVINFIKEKPAPIGSITGDYNLQLFSNSLGMTNNIGLKGATKKIHAGFRFGNKTNADYLQGGGDYVPNSRFSGNSLKTNFGFTNKNFTSDLFYDFSSYNIGLASESAINEILEQGRGRKVDMFYMFLDNHLISSRNKIFFNNTKLELNSAFQQSELLHGENIEEIEIDMKLKTLTYEAKLFLPSTKKSEFIVGIQGINQINLNNSDAEIILLPDAQINNYSTFGLLQFTFFEKLKIQSGLRYDYKTIETKSVNLTSDYNYRPALTKNYGSFSGSLGSTYNLSEKLLFRANFAIAYRTPTLAELTSNGFHESRYELGNNDLVPQVAYETDLSTHYHSDFVTFDLAGFYNTINNYIFISPTSDTSSNGDKIYKYQQSNAVLFGGEANLHFHPKQISWLHFETTFSTVTGQKLDGEYLPFIPANKLKFELKAEKEKIGIFQNTFVKINFSNAFKQNKVAAEETITNAYFLIDCGIGADIKFKNNTLLFGLSANNILDKKYVDHLSTLKEVNYFNPGRNITLSIKFTF